MNQQPGRLSKGPKARLKAKLGLATLAISTLTPAISAPAMPSSPAAASPAAPVTALPTAAPATAQSIAADARKRMEASDIQATGRLVQIAADGSKKTYTFTLKSKWFPDGLRLLCQITSPADSRVRLLMTLNPSGYETIAVGKPGDPAPVTLSFEKWGDPLLNTGFSYEDLADSQFFWQKQTLLPDAKYGARDCSVLKSEPAAAEPSHYSSVTTWIDKTIHATVHVEKSEKKSGHVKQFVYYGLRQNSGVWSAAQIEVKAQGSGGSSLLIIERGSANAHLERKDFDPALLIKP